MHGFAKNSQLVFTKAEVKRSPFMIIDDESCTFDNKCCHMNVMISVWKYAIQIGNSHASAGDKVNSMANRIMRAVAEIFRKECNLY